jgi:chorismate mutase
MTKEILLLRQKIDKIDDGLLSLLKDRIELMEKIGKIKKQNSLSIRDKKREKQKIEIIEQKASSLKLPQQLIKKIWTLLFTHSEEIEK